jgi:hypothetical protein
MPDQDEAVPLGAVIGADADVVLAADLAVRDQRIGAVTAPAPAVPGADDVFAFDRAADAHVGAQVLTVGVQHVQFAGLGAEHHQFLPEVVRSLDVAGSQLRSETDDEPSGRESVGRQADAARPELAFRRVYGGVRNRVRHYPLRSRAADWRTVALHDRRALADSRLFLLF